jgi:hypothetical protein
MQTEENPMFPIFFRGAVGIEAGLRMCRETPRYFRNEIRPLNKEGGWEIRLKKLDLSL